MSKTLKLNIKADIQIDRNKLPLSSSNQKISDLETLIILLEKGDVTLNLRELFREGRVTDYAIISVAAE